MLQTIPVNLSYEIIDRVDMAAITDTTRKFKNKSRKLISFFKITLNKCIKTAKECTQKPSISDTINHVNL
jgi:hypothetical protein